jgi:hypothetical protein
MTTNAKRTPWTVMMDELMGRQTPSLCSTEVHQLVRAAHYTNIQIKHGVETTIEWLTTIKFVGFKNTFVYLNSVFLNLKVMTHDLS